MSGPPLSARIGQPLRRREDQRFITGQGRYADDLELPNQAFAAMVRSSHAHARIRSIDVAEALAVPGVLAVLTGRDWRADGLNPIANKTFSWHPAEIRLNNSDGASALSAPDFPLPDDKSRFVGEPLAMVLAETTGAAKDGAERVVVDYEPLSCVIFAPHAARSGAPLLPESHGSNICIDAYAGDAEATEAAFARAAHVARIRTWVPRVAGSPMELRSATGDYDAATGQYTIYTCNG